MHKFFLAKIAVYSATVILFYILIKFVFLANHSQQLPEIDLTSQHYSRYGSVFPSSFNRTCTSGFLDRLVIEPPRCTSKTNISQISAICSRLTCRNLLRGDDRQLSELAANFTLDRKPISNELLIRETKDCAVFRQLRGFVERVDPQSVNFPIAYNVLTHSNVNQLVRLLRAIYRPNNAICIHVDNKTTESYRSAVESVVKCFDNIRLASRSETIIWAGYSRLQADINCMKDHLDSDNDWRYLINTAALAYPLRTVEETVKILRAYNGANDVEGIFGNRVHRSRFESEWLESTEKRTLRKTGRLNPRAPHNIDIVRGSAYAVFSRRFVEFIVRDQRARDLLEWSRRTWSPDEFYWATLHHTFANPHLHTPGGYTGYPSSKPWLAVYANWGEERCHGRSVRGVCVFGVGDLPLLTSRRELFANKLYEDQQPVTLDCLESWLRDKEVCPPNDDLDYYRQLPFVLPERW